MQVVIYGAENARTELMNTGTLPGLVVETVSTIASLLNFPSPDAFVIFSFQNTDEELGVLRQLKGLVIIDSVLDSLKEIGNSFVRINGWPGFMNSIIEASALNEALKTKAEVVLRQFNKSIEWLPDDPGFVSPRVISMIINEAYFALSEGVSTKENIDLAMKLGTAYPYGPFEWGQKIGLKNIVALLTRLCKKNTRYFPCFLLVKEADEASV